VNRVRVKLMLLAMLACQVVFFFGGFVRVSWWDGP
jgi:hypothetical protein